MVTGAGDGRRRAAADGSRARADGSRARAESRDETRTRERVRRAGGERSSEWLGFGGVAASSFIWGGAGGGRGLGRARRACAWSCAAARARWERAATGPTVGAGRARAVPRAWGAAQARLAPSGRASPGPLATGPGLDRAKKTGPVPGQRARAAWPTIGRWNHQGSPN